MKCKTTGHFIPTGNFLSWKILFLRFDLRALFHRFRLKSVSRIWCFTQTIPRFRLLSPAIPLLMDWYCMEKLNVDHIISYPFWRHFLKEFELCTIPSEYKGALCLPPRYSQEMDAINRQSFDSVRALSSGQPMKLFKPGPRPLVD